MAVDALHSWLEQVLPGPVSVVGRQRSRHIGSYTCEVLAVEMADGTVRKLFLKDYSCSRQSKDEPDRRRDRELRVYHDLLDGAQLGTPTYYGSVLDESTGGGWLLLEFVEAEIVQETDVRLGPRAAAWLARMQAHFRQHADLLDQAFLVRHDAAFFRGKAGRAEADVEAIAPECASRLHRVLTGYQPVIDVLTSQPRSLVHGGYIPWHIMVDERCEPPRVCVLDWELAASGGTLHDLAYFTDGAEPAVRDPIVEAYYRAADAHSVPVPDDPERVMACVRLHRVVDWLSRAVEKQYTAKKTTWLVERAESLAQACSERP